MRGGGSEELWYNVAIDALEKGHTVAVCVKKWPEDPIKIKNLLERNGVTLIFREVNKKPSIFQRGVAKITRRKMRNDKFVDDLVNFDPDSILISHGATFDYFQNELIYKFVQKNSKALLPDKPI